MSESRSLDEMLRAEIREDGPKLKVSGTGWLCAWDSRPIGYVPIFKLTDEQSRKYREALAEMGYSDQSDSHR